PGHRPSELSTEPSRQLVRLLVGRASVDEHADAPVPLGHDLRRIRDGGDRETVDIRPLYLPFANVENEGDATEVICRAMVERKVARAHQLTRARLDVASLQFPGHTYLP